MKLAIDQYAHLSSPIHRWNAQHKLIGLITLIFAFAFVEDLRLIPAMLGVVITLYGLSKLPLSFLAARLRYPGLFILAMVGFLPFLSGETVLWQLGSLTIRQEGCLAVLLIISRFLSIFTTGLVLFGTDSFLTLVKAMRSLGLSQILTDIIFLTYRYLLELSHQLTTMQKATQLRGFQPLKPTRRNLEVYAALTGGLLIRSYQKSHEVYKAMQLRGYGYCKPLNQSSEPLTLHLKAQSYSLFGLLLSLGIAAGFVGWEILI